MNRLRADNPSWFVTQEMIIGVLQDIKRGKGMESQNRGGAGKGPPSALAAQSHVNAHDPRLRSSQQGLDPFAFSMMSLSYT